MTTNRMGSLVVVNLDRINHGVAKIESILEPLGIPVEVVESGRQLRWNTAVVLRVPEHRIADVMLALEVKGFADVIAYQSETELLGEQGGWKEGRARSTRQRSEVETTDQRQGGELC
jgi:hypothetical protein